jgi:hypothetical protein
MELAKSLISLKRSRMSPDLSDPDLSGRPTSVSPSAFQITSSMSSSVSSPMSFPFGNTIMVNGRELPVLGFTHPSYSINSSVLTSTIRMPNSSKSSSSSSS